MRERVTSERIQRFMQALGAEARAEGRVYLTGGASAVLIGWRTSTIDVDIKIVPEQDSVARAIPRIKEQLHVNVELAAPDQFIPELPGWPDRSAFIERVGTVSFHHYDFYAQALSKLERSHALDLTDVQEMLARGLVQSARALDLFAQIEPGLYRYPAIDAPTFRKTVESVFRRP
jgi:hypothetical protein